MRRILAPLVLAAALVGVVAPAASAESCYGTADAYFCFDGDGPSIEEQPVGTCLYTGGSECTPYYVDVPSVNPGRPTVDRVCYDGQCYTGEDVWYVLEQLGCRINPRSC